MRTLLTSFVLAERLDEGLELLERYWSGQSITYHARHYRANDVALLPTPQQRPRPPIWIGGFWPNRRPMRRAARWDGAVPLFHSARHGYTPPVDEVRELADYVRSQHHPDRTTAPFELVVGGVSPSSQEHARDLLGPLIDAGATWWDERRPHDDGVDHLVPVMRRIEQGPPKLP